jgi:putative membrane protein
MGYYLVKSLQWGPLFPIGLIYLYFRYRTLHYRFDDEGVAMGWGVLFRREIHLTYSRIQDIHLTSGIVERYLGLARIHVQTASGQAKAEMVIEGLRDAEEVRDFLYSRMRGLKDPDWGPDGPVPVAAPVAVTEAAVAALQEAATELKEIRLLLEQERAPGKQTDA